MDAPGSELKEKLLDVSVFGDRTNEISRYWFLVRKAIL